MICENDKHTDIWLGEGDISIGIAINEEGKACGIGFQQLKNEHEIGLKVEPDDITEGIKPINILFTNGSGIESLLKGIERFIQKVVDDEQKESRPLTEEEELSMGIC